jgi:hypothetical protein
MVSEGHCVFSLGLVAPLWADLIHYHHTLCGDFWLQIETTMVRTIWCPSSTRRDESTHRHQGVLLAARLMLTSGCGGHLPSLSSSIRHPPSTVDSAASNPLLPAPWTPRAAFFWTSLHRRPWIVAFKIGIVETPHQRRRQSSLYLAQWWDVRRRGAVTTSHTAARYPRPSNTIALAIAAASPSCRWLYTSQRCQLSSRSSEGIYSAILLMLSSVWKIDNPREYQIKAMFYLVFLRVRMMYLIWKTQGRVNLLFFVIIIYQTVINCKMRQEV